MNGKDQDNNGQRSPAFVIAGIRGGAGKTIVTLGIIRLLTNAGNRVIPFKKGPDYIDARWMAMAADNECFNLDPYLMDRQVVEQSFCSRLASGDIGVVEGNRGLHDGVDVNGTCSTAELAKWLKAPVLLVVDCTKITRTAAALVLGCLELDPEVDICGVILNRIARPRHQDIVTNSIESLTGVPVLGAMPRMKKDPLPMRHLGLTPADEHEEVSRLLDRLAETVEGAVDVDRILKETGLRPETHQTNREKAESGKIPASARPPGPALVRSGRNRPVVAVIRDQAFQFYYPENLESIESAGARLIFLSAISDRDIPPEVSAIYIGGGFPETQAARLSENTPFIHKFREMALAGLPVYAECGGLMYLGRNIVWHDMSWPMTGLISWDFTIRPKPAGHGYSILEVIASNPFFKKGERLKGHEFHYSVPSPASAQKQVDTNLSCRVIRGHGFANRLEGVCRLSMFGTYTHIHAMSDPAWGRRIAEAARQFRQGQENSE